jgi:phenylalanyl-tRNA synthetase beta chain
MRAPISWIKKIVPVTTTTEEVAHQLTIAGIEVETIESIGAFNSQIVAAKVVNVAEDTGVAGILRLSVSIGSREIQVISSDNSLKTALGILVPLALPGAKVFDSSAGNYQVHEVTAKVLYGINTEGVLCSAKELGIGSSHIQVLRLPASAIPGHSVIQFLGRSSDWDADEILLISILPNIARCQSIIGIAREVSALTGLMGVFPSPKFQLPFSKDLAPSISVPKLCSKIVTATLEDISIGPSPAWIQRMLALSGLQPINNVVDAASYVMLETGQPLHTYDADKLPNPNLEVRLSKKGESIRTLLQSESDAPLSLPEGLLIIASNDKPVAIAGVLGGLETAVTTSTARVEVESANFDFLSIRRTQSALKINTEASARFSRGVDPWMTDLAINRFVDILRETCPHASIQFAGIQVSEDPKPISIDLSLKEINDSLGTEFHFDDVGKYFDRIGITWALDKSRDEFQCIVPSSRRDILLACDLIEEVARLSGYDKLPVTMPVEPIPMQILNREIEVREQVRDVLVRCGLQEIITYTLSSPGKEALLSVDGRNGERSPKYVKLLNPISGDRTVMRRTLIPGLLDTMAQNLRFAETCSLFEIGIVVLPELSGQDPRLPREKYKVAFALTGLHGVTSIHDKVVRPIDFYDLSGTTLSLVQHFHLGIVDFEQADVSPYHPQICAEVKIADKAAGFMGALHPSVASAFDIEGHTVYCAEFDMEDLMVAAPRFFKFIEPDRYPSIEIDISMVVDIGISSKRIREIIGNAGGNLVKEITVFDYYVGPQIPDNCKSLGMRLRLNSDERTLTMNEAIDIRSRVADELTHTFGAIIRDEKPLPKVGV